MPPTVKGDLPLFRKHLWEKASKPVRKLQANTLNEPGFLKEKLLLENLFPNSNNLLNLN
jgi:hypothetical protein